jgi:hypothetical protein
MNKYKNITDDEFMDAVLKSAKNNIDETLRIPGVYELISEHYNNEALDLALEESKEKRRFHLANFIEEQKRFKTPMNFVTGKPIRK